MNKKNKTDKILSSSKERVIYFLDSQDIDKKYFYDKIGVVRSNFSGKGLESRLGEDIIVKILNEYPSLSPEWLLLGTGEMLKGALMPQSNPCNVFDFVSAGAAGEAMVLLREDKYKTAPTLFLPELGPGIHIRTPVSGDSMHSTIKDGDKAVSTLLQNIQDIRPGHIYAILDKTDGLVYKRIYLETDQTLTLFSDNEIIKPYTRHFSEIQAMFRVREVHTSDLRPYFNDLRRDINILKAEVSAIKKRQK